MSLGDLLIVQYSGIELRIYHLNETDAHENHEYMYPSNKNAFLTQFLDYKMNSSTIRL